MRPTPSGKNGTSPRARTRGAIRTHLGRKRTGGRMRPLKQSTLENIGAVNGFERRHQEDLFDRLLNRFQDAFGEAEERTLEAFDAALDTACEALISAGEFTADGAHRLREYVRRDLLHRDNPALTFRTGDVTSAGTLTCAGCGFTLHSSKTTVLPPCPQCAETAYRKTG